jgi:hypothetical protein
MSRHKTSLERDCIFPHCDSLRASIIHILIFISSTLAVCTVHVLGLQSICALPVLMSHCRADGYTIRSCFSCRNSRSLLAVRAFRSRCAYRNDALMGSTLFAVRLAVGTGTAIVKEMHMLVVDRQFASRCVLWRSRLGFLDRWSSSQLCKRRLGLGCFKGRMMCLQCSMHVSDS